MEQWRLCVCSSQASASSFLWRWCASRSSAWSPATRPSGSSTTTPGPSRAPVPPSPCSSWAAWPCSSSPCPTCRATPGRRAWTPSPTSWTEATPVLQLGNPSQSSSFHIFRLLLVLEGLGATLKAHILPFKCNSYLRWHSWGVHQHRNGGEKTQLINLWMNFNRVLKQVQMRHQRNMQKRSRCTF